MLRTIQTKTHTERWTNKQTISRTRNRYLQSQLPITAATASRIPQLSIAAVTAALANDRRNCQSLPQSERSNLQASISAALGN